MFKRSGASKQKKNYFEEKYKSFNRIIKHNERFNCFEGEIVFFITSAKITDREGSISPSSFYEQLPYY